MQENVDKKYNVLVVEDESVSLEMLCMILDTTDKINCIQAKSGKEAIELYKTNSIDCTFLDINIPAPNGIDTLKQIKTINPKAIVVMQTASNDIETVKKAIALGAASYIAKPYEPEKILESIEKLLFK